MPANHCIPHSEEARLKMRMARLGKPAPWKVRPTKLVDGVMLYRCGTCHDFLARESFYKTKRTQVGITSACKKCHTECSMRTRDKDNHRKTRRENAAKQIALNPEKYRAIWRNRPRRKGPKVDARMIVALAVRIGAITRPDTCEKCKQQKKITAHHEDYLKPLNVRWLCHLCHAEEHRKPSITTTKGAT